MTTASSTTLPAVRALLANAIDYAGLFPPAELGMDAAVDNYLAYRTGENAWALGKLVVPVARLGELESSLARLPAPWPRVSISALVGFGTADDVDAIERFNQRHLANGAQVESVEVKVAGAGTARAVLAVIPRRLARYVEVLSGDSPADWMDVIAAADACAKVRTGGTTPDAFPDSERLAAFLEAAAARKLPFKATAGLHHPVRGAYRLSYADDPPMGMMYGYLNLLIASAIAWAGGHSGPVREALLEEDPAAFWIHGDAIVWRHQRVPTRALLEMRKHFAHGFGSCSFTEPVEELNLRSAQ